MLQFGMQWLHLLTILYGLSSLVYIMCLVRLVRLSVKSYHAHRQSHLSLYSNITLALTMTHKMLELFGNTMALACTVMKTFMWAYDPYGLHGYVSPWDATLVQRLPQWLGLGLLFIQSSNWHRALGGDPQSIVQRCRYVTPFIIAAGGLCQYALGLADYTGLSVTACLLLLILLGFLFARKLSKRLMSAVAFHIRQVGPEPLLHQSTWSVLQKPAISKQVRPVSGPNTGRGSSTVEARQLQMLSRKILNDVKMLIVLGSFTFVVVAIDKLISSTAQGYFAYLLVTNLCEWAFHILAVLRFYWVPNSCFSAMDNLVEARIALETRRSRPREKARALRSARRSASAPAYGSNKLVADSNMSDSPVVTDKRRISALRPAVPTTLLGSKELMDDSSISDSPVVADKRRISALRPAVTAPETKAVEIE